MKHTPGPWPFVPTCGVQIALAKDAWAEPSFVESHANARLIAAAPELLQACIHAIHALKGREHDGFLRTAIAKATGGGE